MLFICSFVGTNCNGSRPDDQFEYLLSSLQEMPRQAVATPLTPPPSRKEVGNEDVMTESLVSQVKDLLPHLGNGFIKASISSNTTT